MKEPKLAHLTVVNLEQNDTFTKMKSSDLTELFCELEMSPLQMRQELGLPKETSFGMEIEFEDAIRRHVSSSMSSQPNLEWEMQSDGSVAGEKGGEITGGEIVSPVLKDEPKSYEDLSKICEILKTYRAKAGNRAGGHIHIGSQIIGEDYDALSNFLKTWTAFERVMYRFAYGDKIGPRKNITYAGPIGNELIHIINALGKGIDDYPKLRKNLPNDRYIAVNFKNFWNDYRRKDTIEFRCPNGTINPIVWQNNLNVFVKMLDRCKSKQFNVDVVDRKLRTFKLKFNHEFYRQSGKVNLPEALDFVDLCFDKNIDKVYFLKQYAKFFNEPKKPSDNITTYCI